MRFYQVVDNSYYAAYFLRFTALIMLAVRMWSTRNCSGISGKAQIMTVFAYTSRYLHAYFADEQFNIFDKASCMVFVYFTLFTMFVVFRKSYEQENDTFRAEILVIACALMAVLVNHGLTVLEVLKAFSLYMEIVAIVPQIFFTLKSKRIAPIALAYVYMLLGYRVLYIIHWIDRYNQEGYYDVISFISALFQILIYVLYFLVVIFVFTKYSISDKAPQDAEGFLPTNGKNYRCNVSSIVLTPESLRINDEKVSKTKA